MQKLHLLFYVACYYCLSCCTIAYSNEADVQFSPALQASLYTPGANDKGSKAINYNGFSQLTQEIDPYRQKRLVDINEFVKLMNEEDVIVLDTRSKTAYDDIHIKGAVHLNFSDFTADKLAQVIPSQKTRILIYCNNNFLDGGASLASKVAPLALNIPTFINLIGYGYEDVYELKTVLSLSAAKEYLEFEGTSFLLKTSPESVLPLNN